MADRQPLLQPGRNYAFRHDSLRKYLAWAEVDLSDPAGVAGRLACLRAALGARPVGCRVRPLDLRSSSGRPMSYPGRVRDDLVGDRCGLSLSKPFMLAAASSHSERTVLSLSASRAYSRVFGALAARHSAGNARLWRSLKVDGGDADR